MTKGAARQLAVTVVAATEGAGAGALSRAERSREPFDQVATTLHTLASP
jgi:hypothetical protein